MPEPFNVCIKEALDFANQLAILAEKGESECIDDSCAVLYGVIRDCSHKIRQRAQRERKDHEALGIWDIA